MKGLIIEGIDAGTTPETLLLPMFSLLVESALAHARRRRHRSANLGLMERPGDQFVESLKGGTAVGGLRPVSK